MTLKASLVKKELKALADKEKAEVLQRFFKTGPGQYGAGDKFLGVVVPKQRQVSQKYRDLSLKEIKILLDSKVHEHRFTALAILVLQYKSAKTKGKEKLVKFYLKNKKSVNSWDLVDASAPQILGDWLLEKDREILYRLAKSKNIWERRMAIVSTQTFIKEGQFKDTIKITEMLLKDEHDLIHKACGWMLREVGKQSIDELHYFLQKHCHQMPRVMLRYAIEKLSPQERRKYLLS